jgi:uncharacterized Zn-binding protein involved in type VI secretion
MTKAVRINDPSDHGGYMLTATGTIRNSGIQTCLNGDIHHCPIRGHGDTPVLGDSTVSTGGRKLLKAGDVAGCGAVIIGSATFTVG